MRAILLVALLVPIAAHAQASSGQQQLAGFLASNLSAAMAEIDALKAQNADLQKQLDTAKKPPEAPK